MMIRSHAMRAVSVFAAMLLIFALVLWHSSHDFWFAIMVSAGLAYAGTKIFLWWQFLNVDEDEGITLAPGEDKQSID